MTATSLRAEGVTKAYGATHALRGVDLELRGGEVTALLGENGAGKSTLMKILSGVERPTAGTITLDGEEIVLADTVDAAAHGIAIIHQELNLCPNLTVADNIFLGRERLRWGMVDAEAQRRVAVEFLERLQEPLDPAALAGDLTLGRQQLVEIARALSVDARVLIMDEPTSALSEAEAGVLFTVIRDLTARGVAVVFISHHLEECLEIADHAVVLRDGLVVARRPMAEVDMTWIVTAMVGREEEDLYPERTAVPGEVLLDVRDLVVADPDGTGRAAVKEATLALHEREVVGIFGLMGAGRTELLEALAGRLPAQSGTVELAGRDLAGLTIAERIGEGLVLVPEDRQRDGLVQSLGVGANMALAAVGRFLRGGFVARAAERTATEEGRGRVRLKTASLDAPITSLSGGNQQKVVIGKALLTQPRVLLLDEPSRGIDVGAKADIFALMADLAVRGTGVLFATSEVGEVLHACDRILVMARGRIVADLPPGETTREDILALADGGAQHEGASDER
ncbi:sugar ABC transporter ATP-binding protein [Brachybacterium sp. NBEC-018]|uniref:sugar ABC transporter ATP-binding protein n=1 Tax=Brachybacterium sp. NBEC-018 TaxID=2996004 RepID=UPI0021750B28|nr:sugar ABC transporter ATP-binding protein [Brachybacterium sp. NBEC-018]UVY84526.1 sugar ABC transporter ATP-binding protein [Brachybacterium sp. NBEC-018]